jgi:hypothetical protein
MRRTRARSLGACRRDPCRICGRSQRLEGGAAKAGWRRSALQALRVAAQRSGEGWRRSTRRRREENLFYTAGAQGGGCHALTGGTESAGWVPIGRWR